MRFISRRLYKKVRRPIQRAHDRNELVKYKKLHLGCGTNILPGWANIDLVGHAGSLLHDIIKPFPILSQTINFIYSEHFIEHITRRQAHNLLVECRRMLAPGGVVRLSTPNLRFIIDEYLRGRTTEWNDVNWNPVTPCQMMNEALRLWDHQFVYDFEELELLLKESGFSVVYPVSWRQSEYPELRSLECRPFHGEIIVEATG